MTAHAGERITVAAASKEAGYSTDYLCRKIRQYTGLSTSEYLTSLRMKIARELLVTTDLPIKAIAWKSGYTDEKRFMHQFKKAERITPTQYRNAFDNIRMNL
jgi:AraC-like DNA-binding protein